MCVFKLILEKEDGGGKERNIYRREKHQWLPQVPITNPRYVPSQAILPCTGQYSTNRATKAGPI